MGYVSRGKRYYSSAKRKYKRANQWSKTPQTPRQLALQAYRGVRYLKGLVNSELFHHTQTSTGTIPNTIQIIPLFNIAQGDGDGARTGNSILAKNILMRLQFTNNVSATNTLIRCMVIEDLQTVADTNTFAITDLLESSSTLSALSRTTAGRFKVHKNWFFGINSANNTQRIVEYYQKLHHHVRYNGSASTDIQKGAFYFIAFSDQSVNTPSFSANFKVGYHDN